MGKRSVAAERQRRSFKRRKIRQERKERLAGISYRSTCNVEPRSPSSLPCLSPLPHAPVSGPFLPSDIDSNIVPNHCQAPETSHNSSFSDIANWSPSSPESVIEDDIATEDIAINCGIKEATEEDPPVIVVDQTHCLRSRNHFRHLLRENGALIDGFGRF